MGWKKRLLFCVLFCFCLYLQSEVELFEIDRVSFHTDISLFSFPFSQGKDLRSGQVTKEFREIFKKNGYPLPLKVEIQEDGKKGWILQGEEKFYLREYVDNIYVYMSKKPWWDEYSLQVSGKLKYSALKKACFSVKVFYGKILVKNFSLYGDTFSQSLSKYYFEKEWKLNNATQKMLPGIYVIKILLPLKSQPSSVVKKYKELLGNEEGKIFEKRINIGNSTSFRRYSSQLKKQYIESMKRLNRLFGKLQRVKRLAFSFHKKNPFWEGRKFLRYRWEKWLKKFQEEVKREQKNLEEMKERFFPIPYPITQKSLDSFTVFMNRCSRMITSELGKLAWNVKREKLKKYEDQGMGVHFERLLEQIRILHSRSAHEMKIRLKRKLGYLPPLQK